MTRKEQADALIEKFEDVISSDDYPNEAKKCAILCCDIIMKDAVRGGHQWAKWKEIKEQITSSSRSSFS